MGLLCLYESLWLFVAGSIFYVSVRHYFVEEYILACDDDLCVMKDQESKDCEYDQNISDALRSVLKILMWVLIVYLVIYGISLFIPRRGMGMMGGNCFVAIKTAHVIKLS